MQIGFVLDTREERSNIDSSQSSVRVRQRRYTWANTKNSEEEQEHSRVYLP
jgi:hypothetical protein